MIKIQHKYINYLFSEFTTTEINVIFSKTSNKIPFKEYFEVFEKFFHYNKVIGEFKNRYISKRLKNYILENDSISIFNVLQFFNFIFFKMKLRLTLKQFFVLIKRVIIQRKK